MGSGVYVDDVRAVARQEASIALIAVGILSGLALLTIEWLARGMVKRMRSAGGLLEGMAQGDLTHHIDPGPADEVGHLLRQAASTQQRLSGLVRQIHSASDSIAVASREIASGNQDLSNRTEETASNLQQAASAMVELTGAVRQSASAAAQANQLAASAAEVAARGGTVVGEVVSTMNEINASSRRISDIITVIDGIAFQTNILALNAAVEAARAGEQGRGFAVVAGEVRSLAQRSASAAKEIKCLINDSVERVDTGSRLVGQAGETMDEIVSSVRRVSDIIGEVTTAAVEQSNGIEGVNKSVMLLDQMTQQNAALVEQSAAAADSLRQQAQDLSGTVSAFRLTRDADSPGPSPQAAPAAPAPVPAGSAGFATKLAARLPSAHGGSTPAAAPAAPATAQGGGDDWQSF
ncbi:MAG: methyl-accepting chemotaxis protein [Vitreoscilla sp.]|nr:methyl-accepting chemotaxis protein [Vitreoscilla sp.]